MLEDGNKNALGIQSIEDVAESLAFLADAICSRHAHAVDEHLIRINGLATHLVDFARLEFIAVNVDVKQRKAIDRVFCFFNGCVGLFGNDCST